MEKVIKWKNLELVVRDTKNSHANGGRLEKIWAEDRKSGRIFLIKGSSRFHYEPFSEKIAYIIGKKLGIDVLEYDIIPAHLFKDIIKIGNPFCKYLSICEKIDKKGYMITSVAEIKRAKNTVIEEKNQSKEKEKDKEKKILNREVMYTILPKKYIDTMFLFDAIIGNADRHYGNVHLLRDFDGNIIGAPLLDNGASLLAHKTTIRLLIKKGRTNDINSAYTIAKDHDEQMITTDSLNGIGFNVISKTMEILEEIEPVLQLMPKMRANMVREYIIYRLHKYLGSVKYYNRAEYMRKQNHRKIITKENEYSSAIGRF